MPFMELLDEYADFDFHGFLASVTANQVERVLAKSHLNAQDYLTLLAPAAAAYLEPMAQRASALTRQHFGNCIFIFTPLYISNYCVNHCRYCSFAVDHHIHRRHLGLEEIEAEALRIAGEGIRHLLVLTGEARHKASPEYIEAAIRIIRPHLSAIGIEVYAMTEEEYGRLIEAGVDSLTIYQETYDRTLYAQLHEGGPKADFAFRIDAPERACRRQIRGVAVGALLGLADPRIDSFFTGLHAHYLQQAFPATEVSASFPRMRPFEGGHFQVEHDVDDRLFVQFMLAFRLFLPRVGITVSTRERASFRDHLVRLGVTRMSAGVSTAVGHDPEGSTAQFEIADTRSVDQMRRDLAAFGYQAVMHDWNSRYLAVR